MSSRSRGRTSILTVDIDLQITAEEALKQNVENVQNSAGGDFASKGYECNAGAAVAMNPDTFEILAIASHPTFDLTTYNRDYADLAADSATPLPATAPCAESTRRVRPSRF